MHALIGTDRQRAIDQEPIRCILGVDIKVRATQTARQIGRRDPGPALMDLVILTVVRVSGDALGESVAGLPVEGEAGAVVEDELGGGVGGGGVLGEAGVAVGADGVAFFAVGGLGGEVFGVGGAEDVWGGVWLVWCC